MDLRPPSLTRSPSSSSNTYCSSERSSLDYPSPSLVEQQYKLSSIYDSDTPCSIPPSIHPEPSLPPLNAMSQSEWSTTCVIHPSSSASAMPTIMSSEYDAFGGYESTLSSAYDQDVYQPHHAQSHPSSTPTPVSAETAPRSAPRSSSRTSTSYTSASSAAGSLTPKLKMETASGYGQGVEVSHYPSPPPIHSAYHPNNPSYTSSASGYPSDGQSSWHKSDYQPVEPDQFYYPAADNTPSTLAEDPRNQYRAARPRKAPRRLTTREEANYQCPVNGCGKLFSRSYNFKAHKETHDERREYPFPCAVGDCIKKFVRKTDLQRHHQSVHMKERSHICDYCSRSFARKDTLRRHMDDGCSKRFDLGTLDLQGDSYDGLSQGVRPMGSGPMSQVVQPPGGLPPMAPLPLSSSGMLSSTPRPMRSRDRVAGVETRQSHSWGRC